MKRGRVIILLCLATLVVFMGGCGKKEASVSQLRSDLAESTRFSELAKRLDVEITNFEIVKRQTTPEDKVDTVWVKVDIAGTAVKGKLYYKMTYNLYNDGWLLEKIVDDETGSWSFTPLSGAPQELVDRSVPDGAEILSEEIDLDGGFHRINYSYVEKHLYCDVRHTRQCTLYFGTDYNNFTNNRGEWGPWGDVELETLEDWHINGTWEGSDTIGHTMTLVIDDFSPGSIAYQGSRSGNFNVRGTYQYSSKVWSLTYTMSDTDGLLDGSFYNSDGTVRYYITATGASWETDSSGKSTYQWETSEMITVTYDSLTYNFGWSSAYHDIELTKTKSATEDVIEYVIFIAQNNGLASYDSDNPIYGVWHIEANKEYGTLFDNSIWCLWTDGTYSIFDGNSVFEDGEISSSNRRPFEFNGTTVIIWGAEFEVSWNDNDTLELIYEGNPEYVAHRIKY